MKFKTAIHFLVAAMIAFGVTSCGSDKNEADSGNSSSSSSPNNSTNYSWNSSVSSGDGASTRDEFYDDVANYRFEAVSEAGIYKFPKNVTETNDFSFSDLFSFNSCWGDECYEDYISNNQNEVNRYHYRVLEDDGDIVREFELDGYVVRRDSNFDRDFGSTMSGLRDGILNIIDRATKVEKVLLDPYFNRYYWKEVSSSSGLPSYSSGGGYNTNDGKAKIFRFYHNKYWYVIDLTSALIANPVQVYPN